MNPTPSLAYATPATAPAWKRWLVCSPLARIVIFMAAFIVLNRAASALVHALMRGMARTPMSSALVYLAVFVLPAIVTYLFLVRIVERRKPAELALRRWPGALGGLLAGGLLFSTVVGVLWLLGSYHVTGFNPHADWLPALLLAGIGAGIGEEILFRGVLFRIIEEGLGTWAALLVSALFFGFAHAGNPGATAWSSAAIAIEAGLLFALLYHVTRSLPLCMGLHAAWNFCQGTVYGIPVSGMKADGWLVSTRTGPDWLSGGVFGAEASVVALTLCLLCSAALLALALRRHSVVPPSWRRR
ncbi:type II CAAX endopeptidase family protein [Rhodanobacter sp. DHB23]|uniref:CPBP family intramembrane glutamic endopeptidase n=1 Tax=Rhodanobacter sp. DHB23 TaxID=2775923 RepID=UPI00177F477D|nr:type II CAAX endopeptidase family protein [Rhodanobacter sp. DHB23]MBD8873236.1 CPBP family intramembrane metalloprotease [Rhodanobacter sp. DHB23]